MSIEALPNNQRMILIVEEDAECGELIITQYGDNLQQQLRTEYLQKIVTDMREERTKYA